jgi:cysteine desulfurase/selenocysteine lyase
MSQPSVSFDVARVRASFPILRRRINGRPLVYLDSAATSLTPEEVTRAEADFYHSIGGNVHRGRHALSEEASAAYDGARAHLARFIGARSSDEIVFTSNATAALNLVAAGLELDEPAEILCTFDEHHSAVLPWITQGTIRYIDASPLEAVDPELVRRSIGPRTKAIVIAHASNVTGTIQPVAEVCAIARAHDVVTIVDATQSAPHLRLRVSEMGCDFLALSGHKMLGPTGIGVLYGRREALSHLRPRAPGGGTVGTVTLTGFEWREPPACFEPGTPNIAGALGLDAAVTFLERIGFPAIEDHSRHMARALREGLQRVKGLRILAGERASSVPIVSFALSDTPIRSDSVGITLSDRYGIMARTGLHCAHPLFERLGLPAGAVRISAYVYNTLEEVNYLCQCLSEIVTAIG